MSKNRAVHQKPARGVEKREALRNLGHKERPAISLPADLQHPQGHMALGGRTPQQRLIQLLV